jgi:hypothetical protein
MISNDTIFLTISQIAVFFVTECLLFCLTTESKLCGSLITW